MFIRYKMRAGLIASDKQFLKLVPKSSLILNQNLIFKGLGDIHPTHTPVNFSRVKNLWVDDCNKNFVYYWINPWKFPNLENLYLGSHPCEFSLLNCWLEMYNGNFYLLDNYRDYHRRWADNDQIKLITLEDYEKSFPRDTEEIEFDV